LGAPKVSDAEKPTWPSCRAPWALLPNTAQIWRRSAGASARRLARSPRAGPAPPPPRDAPDICSTPDRQSTIDESGFQIAVAAAAFVLHVLERSFRIFGCVQPCRGFAALLALAPILLERGACSREADGPEIAVAPAYAHGTITAPLNRSVPLKTPPHRRSPCRTPRPELPMSRPLEMIGPRLVPPPMSI
jgi:hypothetical protein